MDRMTRVTIGMALVTTVCLGACSRRTRGDDVVVDEDAGVHPCEERGDGRDGWPCGCTADCAPGAVCLEEGGSGVPKGQCTRSCRTDDPSTCDEGATCEPLTDDTTEGACFATCTTQEDCGPSRVCDAVGMCVALCFEDGDCDGGHCNPYTNLCTADPPRQGGGIWAACLRDEDCRSDNCGRFGRCLTSCLVSEQGCPDGATCFPEIDGVDLGTCVPPCDEDGQCPDEGLGCRASEVGDVCLAIGEECRGPVEGIPDAGPCGCDEDCTTGSSCLAESAVGSPGGFCARDCDAGSPCEDGWACTEGLCYRECDEESDCAPGRICSLYSGLCFNYCDDDAECDGGRCNPWRHDCSPILEGAGQAQPCAADDECRSGLCTAYDEQPGFCTGRCRVSAQDCPDGAFCIADEPGNDSGLCTTTCADDSDCPEGATCWDTVEPAGGPRHCF